MVNEADVIVVGAGASGLMAARIVSEAGKKVIVVEARHRPGGRIHTLEDPGFLKPAEGGAEFIHGNLPVTIGLLKEAGIPFREVHGEMWRSVKGKFKKEDDFMEGGDLLVKRLKQLKEDMTVSAFLDKYFNDARFQSIKDSIKGFLEGYDAADITRASAFALRNEWTGDDDGEQHRVTGGYHQLISYLEKKSRNAGSAIFYSCAVREIHWEHGRVRVTAHNHERFICNRLILTVPLGVLQQESIRFFPSLPEKVAAARSSGFGGVIKILLQFKTAFWADLALEKRIGQSMKNLGWLFSDAAIPTWWTQLPEQSSLLTGWLAGPNAEKRKDADEASIVNDALDALEELFGISGEALRQMLAYFRILNWQTDPFSMGAYSYSTPETPSLIKVLMRPVERTLFYGGEALHEGPQMGTVEGALASGERVAKEVLDAI